MRYCYQNDGVIIRHLFERLQVAVPLYVFAAIQEAYENQNHMFKSIVLTHIANCKKKNKLSKENFEELVKLLDSFRDPYQDFIEENTGRTWGDIKNKILGGN